MSKCRKCYLSPGYLHFQPFLNRERNSSSVVSGIPGVIHLVDGRVLFVGKGLVTSVLKIVWKKSKSLFSLASLNTVDQNYQ